MVMSNNDGSRDASVSAKCHACGKTYAVSVWARDLAIWKAGEYVQVAFPYLSPGERELLVSGTCGGCFDEMFKEEDE